MVSILRSTNLLNFLSNFLFKKCILCFLLIKFQSVHVFHVKEAEKNAFLHRAPVTTKHMKEGLGFQSVQEKKGKGNQYKWIILTLHKVVFKPQGIKFLNSLTIILFILSFPFSFCNTIYIHNL